jgi:hypothetical protein
MANQQLGLLDADNPNLILNQSVRRPHSKIHSRRPVGCDAEQNAPNQQRRLLTRLLTLR